MLFKGFALYLDQTAATRVWYSDTALAFPRACSAFRCSTKASTSGFAWERAYVFLICISMMGKVAVRIPIVVSIIDAHQGSPVVSWTFSMTY